jgi:putative flippase GtrA
VPVEVGRFLRFCLVGAAAYFVDAGVLIGLVSGLDLDPYAARLASFLTAATFTWWLNRSYTFAVSRRPSGTEWAAYVSLMMLGAAVNYGAYAAAITWWPPAREHLWLGVALGSIAGLGVNYLTSARFAFGHSSR